MPCILVIEKGVFLYQAFRHLMSCEGLFWSAGTVLAVYNSRCHLWQVVPKK